MDEVTGAPLLEAGEELLLLRLPLDLFDEEKAGLCARERLSILLQNGLADLFAEDPQEDATLPDLLQAGPLR